MPRQAVAALGAAALLGALFVAGCGDEAKAPPPPGGSGGSAASSSGGASGDGGAAGAAGQAGAGDGGTSGGGAAGSGGAAGDGGAAGSGGAAGDGGAAGSGGTGGVPPGCGDGDLDPDEQCDASLFGGKNCQFYGFSEGALVCTPECSVDASGCSGTETCFDGMDNDGDGDVDCDDADCATDCADSCATTPVLADPASVSGDTTGHPAQTDSPTQQCKGQGGTTGPEVIYEFTPTQTGVIDATVASSANLTLSIRTSCDTPSSELACVGNNVRLTVPGTQGQKVYVVVDGLEAIDHGPFSLDIRSRVPKCGDAVRDAGEECDDGNEVGGDHCDETCHVISDEAEPNGTKNEADPIPDEYYVGEIDPAGDVDWISFQVTDTYSSVHLETFDFGDGACAQETLDSEIEVFQSDGTTSLGSDDDGGDGYCARLQLSGLAAGTYYIRLRASPAGFVTTFPYRLWMELSPCGDGTQGAAEECDDSNKANGDGCDEKCRIE
jgi:cysteine-rich repeat protein